MKKNMLITGASRGIGSAIAIEAAKQNYNLILTCQNSKELLTSLAEDLQKEYHINCELFLGDIGDDQFVTDMFQSITDIDVLINNAGISYIGLLQDMTVLDWHHVINTNVTSAFLCSKYAIPYMLHKQRGKIINISSVWGDTGASTEVAYSASKGALNTFTKALAKELAPSNIQVNAVACGVINTQMNDFLSNEEKIALRQEIPSGRFGTPEEVASLVMSLAGSHDYITGQVITIDGGFC